MSTQWIANDIIVNGIKLYYHRTGGHKPPLVLAHGVTDNGLCWTRLAQALEKDYDLIMYDARGHGLSDKPGSYTLADHVADLAGLVAGLGLDKPVVAGHSMGAANVAAAATAHPGLARAIILEDPPWWSDAPVMAEHLAGLDNWRADMVTRKSKTREEIIAEGQQDSPTWAEVEWAAWAESKRQVDPNVLQWAKTETPFMTWHDMVARLTCPALLVTADPELGAIVPAKVANEAARLNPRLKVVHIAGAGHNIRREQFETYVKAVTTFLQEVGKD